MAELKPCPFCGHTSAAAVRTQFQTHTVECPGCYACGPYELRESDAIAAWNRRAGEQEGKQP